MAEILIRLVVDTNVFVSAALKANSPPFLVIRWLETHGRLLKTSATEEEVLKRLIPLTQVHLHMVTGAGRHRDFCLLWFCV